MHVFRYLVAYTNVRQAKDVAVDLARYFAYKL